MENNSNRPMQGGQYQNVPRQGNQYQNIPPQNGQYQDMPQGGQYPAPQGRPVQNPPYPQYPQQNNVPPRGNPPVQPQGNTYPPRNNPQGNSYYNSTGRSNDKPAPKQKSPKQKSGGGKKAAVIIAVILAVLLIAGTVIAAVFIAASSGNTPEKIVEALSSGRYGDAVELYEDKYGDGKTNDKLNEELIKRLFDLEDEFKDGEISYSAAMREIEAVKEMNISEIAEDIEKTEEYIEKLNAAEEGTSPEENLGNEPISGSAPEKIVEALSSGRYGDAVELYEDKYGDGKTNDKLNEELIKRLFDLEDEFKDGEISYSAAMREIEAVKEMNISEIAEDIEKTEEYIEKLNAAEEGTSPEENLGNEPISGSAPEITSATTLNGVVLAASNTNSARSFGPEKTLDGYYDSCWCVNTTEEGGAGASIRFNLSSPSLVGGIKLVNGNLYMPEDDIFKSNGQIKNFTLTFSDGTKKSFTASYNAAASGKFEVFNFDKPVNTEYIILTVDSGYVGEKYTTNVCLGEFTAF